MPVTNDNTVAPEISNAHRVPQSQWRKWNAPARKAFNSTYDWMINNQLLHMHPKATLLPTAHWKSNCWNAAWIAADAAMGKFWGNPGDGTEANAPLDTSIPGHVEQLPEMT